MTNLTKRSDVGELLDEFAKLEGGWVHDKAGILARLRTAFAELRAELTDIIAKNLEAGAMVVELEADRERLQALAAARKLAGLEDTDGNME
ncbi:hypothetical protein KKE60_08550 [Patescibacteria group bacterium]|nr:hypothetical protein [Patescibacteria group bacterium]